MEPFTLTDDLLLTGTEVKAFPNGIQQAFTNLMQVFGDQQPFYGISWMDDHDRVVYYAMTSAILPGEAKPEQFTSVLIKKGEYHTETIHNWMSQTDCIKDVFQRLTIGTRPDKDHPCIEWYKSTEEMMCMVAV